MHNNHEVMCLTIPSLEPYLEALAQMPPSDQQMVLNLIRGLADRNGVTVTHTMTLTLQTLGEGIPLWLASLKPEQYSPRTIEQYQLVLRNYLKYDPQLSIQRYLAERLAEVSSSRVSMERKALRSLFRFLYSAGVWSADPIQNLKPIKVSYREWELPTEEGIAKLLKADCYHHSDISKFRLMVILLLDVGLRVHEACSIRKSDINFDRL